MVFSLVIEARDRVVAQLENIENTDDVLELTLEELSAISGGKGKEFSGGEPTWCGSGCD